MCPTWPEVVFCTAHKKTVLAHGLIGFTRVFFSCSQRATYCLPRAKKLRTALSQLPFNSPPSCSKKKKQNPIRTQTHTFWNATVHRCRSRRLPRAAICHACATVSHTLHDHAIFQSCHKHARCPMQAPICLLNAVERCHSF
jgi:hypothetical protein